MTSSATCESCGMTIETGRYCQHCVDETGVLQSFDRRFERMVALGGPPASRREQEPSWRRPHSPTWPPFRRGAITPGLSPPQAREALRA
jgi:hypothetical protein